MDVSPTRTDVQGAGRDLPADVAEALERYRDRLDGFLGTILWKDVVGSTNDLALTLAEQGAPEGTVVGADMQTSGRGRAGRVWVSPPGAGLYVSLVLRPTALAANLVTLAAGVAIAEGIEEATGLDVTLKWPNDVHVGGRKVAGILAEAGTSSSRIEFIVLGFGINIMPAPYPSEIAARATSIEWELGRAVDRGLVLASCLAAFIAHYRQLASSSRHMIISRWRERGAWMFGRGVVCLRGEGPVSGVAEDIDESGALIVRAQGEAVRVVSGEVRWA